jgi:hypothetical protein
VLSHPQLFASALVSGGFLGLCSWGVIGQGASDFNMGVDRTAD